MNENNAEKVNEDLIELQKKFSNFLNEIVTTNIENKIGSDSANQKLAYDSMSKFLKDLPENEYLNLNFASHNNYHYDIYDYVFINFNYTSLLDNYIYLDKLQFDPHPYKRADRNFMFYPNPNGYGNFKDRNEDTSYSTYLHTSVLHPHGKQSIARSLLFGTNDSNLKEGLEVFNKEYWVQYQIYYEPLIKETELFIIYGSSIGNADSWWWRNICKRIATGKAELIVYSYKKSFNKKKFIDDYGDNLDLENRIFVVEDDGNTDLMFLHLPNAHKKF